MPIEITKFQEILEAAHFAFGKNAFYINPLVLCEIYHSSMSVISDKIDLEDMIDEVYQRTVDKLEDQELCLFCEVKEWVEDDKSEAQITHYMVNLINVEIGALLCACGDPHCDRQAA
jgi:hypothetical protein